MSILDNAVASIQIGMEDFNSDDPRRVLSAIRNIYAGILLLFKHKLQEMSPADSDEALLKTKVVPSVHPDTGEVAWVGKGKKTVEVHDIQERLTALGIERVDWTLLKGLQNIRNDIEHYYTQLPDAKLREAVSNALHLIAQFCEPYLGRQPADLFGEDTWPLMLSIAAVFDIELNACRQNLSSATWPFAIVARSVPAMRCPGCESPLVRVVDLAAQRDGITFICSACTYEAVYHEVVGPAVSRTTDGENHWRARDGAPPVTEDCPECREQAFISAEGVCAACFYEMEYTHCEYCDQPLTLEDQFLEGMCGYCNYRAEKMAEE